MAKIILITGGSRSGKSAYAQKEAELLGQSNLFIATCPNIDPEMDERINRHRQEREGKGWQTLEEERDIAAAIRLHHHHSVILIDCLTLWINNLLFASEKNSTSLKEDDVSSLLDNVIKEAKNHPGTLIFVTNEVGSGIVPENTLSRKYRDLVGRCNQHIAAAADRVVLVCCSLPLQLK